VLPLKLIRPQWFDGVALVVGAASPDVAYVVDGSGLPVWPLSHEWHGLLLFCLPVTVVLGWIVRRAAPIVAAHLPAAGALALRDYGALGNVRHRWWVTAASALLGAASHVVWDSMADRWLFVDAASHALGALIVVAVMVQVGRVRLIRRWHGAPPAVVLRPIRFWSVAAIVGAFGVAVLPFLPAAFLPHTTGTRLLATVAMALVAGAAAVRLRPGPTWLARW
jgi:hypothetical protein